jgi:hypothetical protein
VDNLSRAAGRFCVKGIGEPAREIFRAPFAPAGLRISLIRIGIIGRVPRLTPLARRLFCHDPVTLAVAKGVSLVAVQTIARPNHSRSSSLSSRLAKPLHRSLPNRLPASRDTAAATPVRPPAAAAETIHPAKLEAVEDRLLADAMDRHANVEAALDGALDDMAVLSAELRRSRCRPLLLRSTTNLNRVEDLLLEAVVRTHPNGDAGLDRLLADVTLDETAAHNEELARAEFDRAIDNDFDGLA